MELSQNEKFIRSVFRKAVIPCMLAMLSANINVVVDGILVGNIIGQEALAAINMSLPLYLALCVVGSFFGYGSSTQAASAIGANRKTTYLSYYRTGTTLLIISSVVITILGLIFIEPIDALLCSDPTVRTFVHEYVLITLIGTLPKLMIYIPYGYLRLDGRNVEVMSMMAIMATSNVILDIIFIKYLNLGVFGAGLASVIATAIVCILGFIWLSDKKSSFSYKPYITRDWWEFHKIVTSGTPFGLNNLFSTLRILMINSILLNMGGSPLVAVFSAVNGVSCFAESLTLGIPQAGNAILGVCHGEGDYPSMTILFKRMLKTGLVLVAVFGALITLGNNFISYAYNLGSILFYPMLMLSISLLFNIFFNTLQNFYNIMARDKWSNALILLRLIIMTYASLLACNALNLSPWIFLPASEAVTFIIWLFTTFIKGKYNKSESTFLCIPIQKENEGRILNFSVQDTNEDICKASEMISDFCSDNGMSPKETMRLSMSIEEILALVKTENNDKTLHFDLRAYSINGVIGIRFRYDGKNFNPFSIPEDDPDDKFLGVKMIENLVASVYHYRTFGTNTVQVLLMER